MSTSHHAWGGRFTASPAEALDAINRSIGVDIRLWPQDIEGSRAHARGLQRIGILSQSELDEILRGLDHVAEELRAGTFAVEPVDEDIHMAVERRLTELVGEPGKKLHTGRSRNDQVATDLRLWTTRACDDLAARIHTVLGRLAALSERHAADPIPAYTHLQRGMPTSLGHHLLAWAEMLVRDLDRLAGTRRRANVSPLGSGACVGSSFPLDREGVAAELGFAGVTQNSLDGVSDRDFVVDLLHAAAMLTSHLSRVGEELVLWSSHEFSFVRLGDAVTTGSSMMPNKKNPDGAELLRGKAGRVIGDLVGLLVTLKGLPLTYNKDLQEDKERVFDAFDTCTLVLDMLLAMLDDMTFDTARMRAACTGWVNATDLCELLVGAGEPLRTAHHQTGRLVALAVARGVEIEALPLDEVQAIAPKASAEMLAALDVDATLRARALVGGPAPQTVLRAAGSLLHRAESVYPLPAGGG
jgi:argininosuccinate lyase